MGHQSTIDRLVLSLSFDDNSVRPRLAASENAIGKDGELIERALWFMLGRIVGAAVQEGEMIWVIAELVRVFHAGGVLWA